MESRTAPRLHVLVVDDIDDSRSALCELVRSLGHEASAVNGGAQALEWLKSRQPDVILLDLLMPGLDGFEVCRRVRARHADRWLPIIGTSSLEGEAHVIRALASGADECLTRPLSPPLLEAKLRHYGRILQLQSGMSTLAQRQRAIQDNILDAVLTLDDHERIVEANLAARRVFSDGDGADLVGTTLLDLTGIDLQALRANHRPEMRRGEGGHFTAEVSVSQWLEQGSRRTTLVIRDLTERLRNERMRDEFLATVSHELRTPLTSVLGALGLLASGAAGALPAGALPLANAAQRNGERLSKLIDDILDLTKLEGDRMVMHLRVQSLAVLLADAIAANQGYADRARVRLELDLPAPDGLGRIEARVDGDRFLQVMANLISNGIKHSPPGARVRVLLRPAKRGWLVRVSDEGPGVDPAFRALLFEKFSQADSSDRRAVGGTGLGLYIARLLVERMGGRIAVAPPDGQGASFDVWFPFSRPSQSEAPLPPTDFGALEAAPLDPCQ